jgi:cold shock CspA family protein
MSFTGILRTWHEDRGFGFIAPTHGGAEVFVHISAFARDGSRPTQGEQLRYELGRGKNGEVQAVKVTRLAVGTLPPQRREPHPARPARWPMLVGIVALGVGAVFGYGRLQPLRASEQLAPTAASQPLATPDAAAPASPYRCDGRRHCSQMSSCDEANYFLKHCPNVEMDGNHDGVPCEQQWCTSSLAR